MKKKSTFISNIKSVSLAVFIALVITAVFIILSNFVFNENCKYNILPEKYKKVVNAMDFNEDGKVSQDEIDRAQQILEKAKQQDELNNKISMLSNISDE